MIIIRKKTYTISWSMMGHKSRGYFFGEAENPISYTTDRILVYKYHTKSNIDFDTNWCWWTSRKLFLQLYQPYYLELSQHTASWVGWTPHFDWVESLGLLTGILKGYLAAFSTKKMNIYAWIHSGFLFL